MARHGSALRDSGPEPRRRHRRFRGSLVREGRLDVDERSRAPDKFRSELEVLAAKWISNNRRLINPAELLGNPGTTCPFGQIGNTHSGRYNAGREPVRYGASLSPERDDGT
jgi:hypothetical protein